MVIKYKYIKRVIIVIIIIMTSCNFALANQKNNLTKPLKKAWELYDSRNYTESLNLATNFLRESPENFSDPKRSNYNVSVGG